MPVGESYGFHRRVPSELKVENHDSPTHEASSSDSNEDVPARHLPTSFHGDRKPPRKVRRVVNARENGNESKGINEYEEMGSGQKKEFVGGENSIAMKMMLKMGFKGRLGAKEDGIIEPVEAVVIKGRLGLGAEEGAKRKKVDGAKTNWKKGKKQAEGDGNRPAKRWQKRARSTANKELFENGIETSSKVIDLRKKKLKDAGSKDAEHGKEPHPATFELAHNLQLLCNIARKDLELVSANSDERIASLRRAKHAKQNSIKIASEKLKGFRYLIAQLSLLEGDDSKPRDAAEEVKKCTQIIRALYEKPNTRHLLKDNKFGIRDFFAQELYPPLSKLYRHSLQKLTLSSEQVGSLTNTLTLVQDPLGGLISSKQYLLLTSRLIISPLKTCVVSNWDPRAPESLVSLLEVLSPVLPPTLLSYIYDEVVVSRLESEIRKSDLRRDSMPIHTWLFAWLPHLNEKQISRLFYSFRKKVLSLLRLWPHSEKVIRENLAAWNPIVSRPDFNAIINNHILPVLNGELDVFFDDLLRARGSRDLEELKRCPLKLVLSWRGIVRSQDLVQSLLNHYFLWIIRFLQLYLLGDVKKKSLSDHIRYLVSWYKSWKEQFPMEFQRELYGGFAGVLFLLEATTLVDPHRAFNVDPQQLLDNRFSRAGLARMKQKLEAAEKEDSENFGVSSVYTFKDTVRELAESRNLAFIPSGMVVDGHPLYRFGSVHIYLDVSRQLIYMYNPQSDHEKLRNDHLFQPVEVEKLITLASG